MKNIIKSLVIVVAVAAVASVATYAVFTASDTIANNTISTATVKIDATGEARGGVMAKPINTSGLIPGQYSPWARGAIHNLVDSTNVRVYMYVTNKVGTACNKTNLVVTTGNACDGCSGERANEVYNGSLSGIDSPGERKELTGYVFVAPNYLPPHWSLVIQQRAQLDSTAGDSYQGTSCTWDEIFVAETPVPPPTP